jgi:zinc transporter ZupT
VVVGLLFAVFLGLLGVGAGMRQFVTLARVRTQHYMADEDRRYFHSQARRRMLASGLLVVIGVMIATFYLSGMDAWMNEVRQKEAEEDKDFAKLIGFYWISVILLVGVVICVAVIDLIATRKYWMTRYKELKADHEAKLQRDLAVFRQQKLNDRARGLRKSDDETPPEGNEPLGEE